MKKLLIFLSILTLLFFSLFPIDDVEARRGCCSWHGGVCSVRCCDGSIGYRCCDRTPLSSKCAPYYPQCGVCQQPPSEEEKSPPPSEEVITYSYDYSKPILRTGSRGYWVIELQKMLNCAVYGNTNILVLDGIFGPKTNHAVVHFQSSYANITIDGIVGPQTWGLLEAVCNQ